MMNTPSSNLCASAPMPLTNIILVHQHLSRQHRTLSSPHLGVVGQHHILQTVVERRIGPQTAYHGGHAVVSIGIQAWLWPIRVVMHHDELAWRRRQAQVYKLPAKAFHGLPRFGDFGWPGGQGEHALRMAVHHRHARTGGTDAYWQRFQASRGDLAEDLTKLSRDFVF